VATKRKTRPKNARIIYHERACVNGACRRVFMVRGGAANGSEVVRGLCPTCAVNAQARRGDLLDPALYVACQKAARAEKKLGMHNASKARVAEMAKREERALRRLDAKPVRMSPEMLNDYLSDGYKPRGRSGKVGVTWTDSSGREGRG
jgi:hypothetical protein